MEKFKINLSDQTIEYEIKKSPRAKRMSVSVKPGGRVIATIPTRGHPLLVDQFLRTNASWLIKKVTEFSKYKSSITPAQDRKSYLAYKEAARRLIERKLAFFNKYYQFTFNRVAIRNQSSCWGSCSAKGNLNFNYKLVFLPEKLVDYVVVHELCHLREMNHSLRFWKLVEQLIPDFESKRKELKKEGLALY